MVNLIFMPKSFVTGMAGSKRMGNFIPLLREQGNYRLTNLILSNKPQTQTSNQFDYIQQISIQNLAMILHPFKLITLFKKLFQKNCTNIIYYYGYPDIVNFTYLYTAKKLGYKIIFDIVENNFTLKNFNSLKVKLRILSSHIFMKRLKYIANGIICISTQLNKMLTDIVGVSIPVLLLPITINKNQFLDPNTSADITKVVKIFYGGSFGEKDGLNYLLKAFDIVADRLNIKLVMTGKGNTKDENKTLNLISELKNKDKINLMGFLNDEEYYATLKSADIHCMTRVSSEYANYGFPFKLGEMLATGKPVIVTRVGDVTKYVNESEAILIEPESVELIVKALDFLIINPEDAFKIGRAGRECAFRNFDSEKHTDRLCNFMESLK